MTEVRTTLKDASALLGIAQNTLRSRYKAGKLRGERDNSGRLWIWVDPSEHSSKRPFSKNAKIVRDDEVLEALKSQLVGANAELGVLRKRASLVDRLEAEKESLNAQVTDLRARLDLSEAERRDAQTKLIELLSDQRPASQLGFWARLFGRGAVQ